MTIRPQHAKWLWLLAAAGFLTGAGLLQKPLDVLREEHQLVAPGDAINEDHPELAVLNLLPGGLRAWGINWLWIRSQKLHQEERYYDARQRAEWICKLMPYHPSVWIYQAWNLAWNISANTHTPHERWNWVRAGMELLRDEAIPRNPKSLLLYKELAWVFFFKMGLYTDEMNMTYKQRWASQMQELLGAPPYGTADEVIEAFRPIAEVAGWVDDRDAAARQKGAPEAMPSLLDKDPRRQGEKMVQADMRDRLLADVSVAAYAARLAKLRVNVDEVLLAAYNRFSREDPVEVVRVRLPDLTADRDKAISEIINDPRPEPAAARRKMLAFVRAQILWNHYRMDPAWMMKIMIRYHLPLDWRHVMPHSLYWVTYGLNVVEDVSLMNIDSLNTERIVLNSLKSLTWTGQMVYLDNPRQRNAPQLSWASDWRYIDATQQEYLAVIQKIEKDRGEKFEENIVKDGHMNYLVGAMAMYYAGDRRGKAHRMYQDTKDKYKPAGPEWKLELEDFLLYRITRDRGIIRDFADAQITASLIAAFENLARRDRNGYARCYTYARRIHVRYQKESPDRQDIAPFNNYVSFYLANMIARPALHYANLSLLDRSFLYASVDTELQVILYDRVSTVLRRECAEKGLDFDKAFPAPPGLRAYREEQQRQLAPVEP